MSSPHAGLRAQLELETYPHRYTHKFLGGNTAEFSAAVARLEATFPQAVRVGERRSGGGGDEARYIAYTYELPAESVDDIIALIEATMTLADLKMIL